MTQMSIKYQFLEKAYDPKESFKYLLGIMAMMTLDHYVWSFLE